MQTEILPKGVIKNKRKHASAIVVSIGPNLTVVKDEESTQMACIDEELNTGNKNSKIQNKELQKPSHA